ncbi:MAG TPA: PEGA domain-containing protein, partial [Archangium sp.]
LEAEPPPDQPDKPAANDTQVASATGTGTGTGTQQGTSSSSPSEQNAPKQGSAPQTASANGSAPEQGTDTRPAAVEPPKPATFEAVFVGDSGAEIEVGGKRVGKTPDAKLANLTIGKTYAFTVTRAGYKRFSGKFRSEGETELEVPFELEKEEPAPAPERTVTRQPSPDKSTRSSSRPVAKGKLACSSRPAGAQIWVDGKNTGRQTPVALGNPLLLPVGSRSVVFKLGGKQSKPQKVTISEGDVAKLINVPLE